MTLPRHPLSGASEASALALNYPETFFLLLGFPRQGSWTSFPHLKHKQTRVAFNKIILASFLPFSSWCIPTKNSQAKSIGCGMHFLQGHIWANLSETSEAHDRSCDGGNSSRQESKTTQQENTEWRRPKSTQEALSFQKTSKKRQATGRVPASADSADVPLFFPWANKGKSHALCSKVKWWQQTALGLLRWPKKGTTSKPKLHACSMHT